MIVCIDIGNTNVVIGVNKNDRWQYLWRWNSQLEDAEAFHSFKLSNEILESRMEPSEVEDIVLSSVVPALSNIFFSIVTKIFYKDPILLDSTLFKRLNIKIDRPNEIGSDLVANALAAHYKYKGNRIVVDFGTALTFTTINAAGHLLGVSIAPGLKTSIAALVSKTAQLPEVPLKMPKSAIGKNTIQAIQSGILNGYVGLVRHHIKLINEELKEPYLAIATGGLSSILAPLAEDFEVVDRNLTLEGLKIVSQLFGKNAKTK